jgi:NAD(P)-dependent dehydrogenase (short-subunit alcohol dehydrogenase family)
VHTPFVDRFLAENYPGREAEMLGTLAATQPIGRMATPSEIAALIAYLASDEAAFVTGQVFAINGGALVVGI